MTKKKPSSAARPGVAELEGAGNDSLPELATSDLCDVCGLPIVFAAGSTVSTCRHTIMLPEAAAPKPPRKRAPQAAAAPLELDPQFLKDPARMQYALLLAMLLRARGTVRLSAKDLEPGDTDYNVVFARTRDGKYLEVSVVSSESGIIRSPEREAAQWRHPPETQAAAFQPLPRPIPFPTSAADPDALREEQLRWALSQPARSGPFSNGSGPVPAPRPEAETTKTAMEEAERFLARTGVAEPKDGSASYHFPFEVGSAPSTAGPADLSSLQSRLLNLDRQIETEQQEAIARMENP